MTEQRVCEDCRFFEINQVSLSNGFSDQFKICHNGENPYEEDICIKKDKKKFGNNYMSPWEPGKNY